MTASMFKVFKRLDERAKHFVFVLALAPSNKKGQLLDLVMARQGIWRYAREVRNLVRPTCLRGIPGGK